MFTKHFFKILIIFTGMIVLGLIGVYVVSQLEGKDGESNIFNSVR